MGRDRTSLVLNDNKPLNINGEITLSFDMQLRKEIVFGTIVRIISNTKEHITLSFSADEKDNRYPSLVVNESLNPISDKVEYDEWFPVSIRIVQNKDSLYLSYQNVQKAYAIRLEGWKDIMVSFGTCPFEGFAYFEVPPMNLKDVKVFSKNQLIRHWALNKHYNDECFDLVNGVPALAKNPQWIIDSHIEWTKIYSREFKTSNNPQYAYNPQKDILYIVPDEKSVICFNATRKQDTIINVLSGYPAGNSTNQLVYNPLKDELISYNLEEKTISRFSFKTSSWSKTTPAVQEPRYWHHTTSFYEADTSVVTFGGYGFYLYKNELQKGHINNNTWENSKLISITPRYSSASAIVGDKLYIFGGKGSESGKQELNPHLYFDLYSVDLKTNETTQLWQMHTDTQYMPCGNMIFNPKDSCFYVLVSLGNGTLYKISMASPEITAVSNSLGQSIESDFPFYTLFYSPNQEKLYALLCRNFNSGNADIFFYEINFPPISQSSSKQQLPFSQKTSTVVIAIIACISLLLGFVVVYFIKNKKKLKASVVKSPIVTDQNVSIDAIHSETEHFFDRTNQCISLLGGFNVVDKNKTNITPNFTPILKSLLLLILLNSDNEEKGINSKKIDSLLWFDKDEKAARNNRNVSLNRLKILLENIGDIKLINNGGFWKIVFGDNVFCDYYTVLEHIREAKAGNPANQNLIPELLELLTYGPLLPYTHADWLDKFKGNYSNNAIDILNSLLIKKELLKDDDLRLLITDTIFLYDSLNEEALGIKCLILYSAGKKGLAKSTYDNFAKEYHSMLGESYKYSLSQIIDFAVHGWPVV
ncbi:Kelch repeat-containing protein [Viscerimonas tarda]